LPRNIDPEVFKAVRTLQDVVDAIYNLIHSESK
jgi:acyl carrier protein